ncbi:MAG: hypothetical protein KAH01_02695 [Caldisericia bacterium]|nr:hypothetical protein [Caldisericia bacterium]
MKRSWIQRTLVYLCVLVLFFTILPVKQSIAIPRPCNGAISGSISPASCGAGFRITVKNENGETLWEGTTDSQGNFTTPFSLPGGTAIVEAMKIGCNITPSSQKVTVECEKKATVRFTCKCEGHEEKGRILVYMPKNCLRGTSVRITGVSNNQSMNLTEYNQQGAFDSGCELFCNTEYVVQPINKNCTFSPESRRVKVACCPKETKVTFSCDCKKDSGRIVVYMPEDCKPGTYVDIFNEQGTIVKTLSGVFDTGCTLPCQKSYKVVPRHPQKAFTPKSVVVNVPCCPEYARAEFTKCTSGSMNKGRIKIEIPRSCISGTTVNVYNSNGSLVKTLNSASRGGYFDTECTLPCPGMYNIIPKNANMVFSPASQRVSVKCCPDISQISFRCSEKPKEKGRIVVKLPYKCIKVDNVTTVINLYNEKGSLVDIIKPDSQGQYDTQCSIESGKNYTLVPQNDNCTFSPSKKQVLVLPCPDITTAAFTCECGSKKGRIIVKMDEKCLSGTKINIYDENGRLYTTLTSVNPQGEFDSGCSIPCNKKYEIVPYNPSFNFSPSRKVVYLKCCPDISTVIFSCGSTQKKGSFAIYVPENCQKGTSIYIYDTHGNVAKIITSVDSDGYFRTGCTLLCNESYKIVPKNNSCTFDPPVKQLVLDCCPSETKTSFECDCEEKDGRIKVHLSRECATDAVIHIYDINNNLVITVTSNIGGVFDTGCVLPCDKYYKVVPEKKDCTFSPASKTIEKLLCCPEINQVAFECECDKNGGRLLIKIPEDCINVEKEQTAIYIYDQAGNIADIINAPGADGYYDTGKTLKCDEFYKVKPKNSLCTFSPESQLVKVDCSKDGKTVQFQCSCTSKKGRIYSRIDGGYDGVSLQVFDESSKHLILTLTNPGSNGFDTGCILSTNTMYKLVPSKDGCTFSPPSISVQPKACPDSASVTFKLKCQPDCFGGFKGYFLNRYTKGTSIQILKNGNVTKTIQSDSLTGFFDSGLSLEKGTYTLKPSKEGCIFSPETQTINIVCNDYSVIEWEGNYQSSTKPVIVWLDSPINYVKKEQSLPASYKIKVMVGDKGAEVSNFMAAKIVLHFDENYFAFVDVNEGSFLKKDNGSTFFTHKLIDGGMLEIDISRTNGSVGGFGEIATVTFSLQSISSTVLLSQRAGQRTLTSIGIEKADIRNKDGVSQSVLTENCIFYVQSSSSNESHICDFNKDGLVNFDDMMIFSLAYGKRIGNPGWNSQTQTSGSPFERCDVWCSRNPPPAPAEYSIGDGVIDFNDLVFFSMNFRYFAENNTSSVNKRPIVLSIGRAFAGAKIQIVQPLKKAFMVGDEVAFNVAISEIDQIVRGIQLTFEYQNDLLEFVSVTEGNYLKDTKANGTMFMPTNNGATIEISTAVMGEPKESVIGGLIATVNFKCLKVGSVVFNKKKLDVRNIDNKTILTSFESIPFSITGTQKRTIKLVIGSKSAFINDKEMVLDVPPTIVSGRTMVPIRFVSEGLGAKVEWDGETKTISIVFGDDVISMIIGVDVAIHNGKAVKMDAPPFIMSGRTMVPIRFVSEGLGAKVEWDGETRTVTIIK